MTDDEILSLADLNMVDIWRESARHAPRGVIEEREGLLMAAGASEYPVGGALCSLSHGIAGIYWVGTVEEAHGQGVGEALARVATNWGFDQGGRFASLQAATMGDPIYRRMGYRQVGAHRWASRFSPPADARL